MTEGILIGHISTNPKGFGFFVETGAEESIFIEPGKLNTALNGDTVEFKITGESDQGPFGEVVKVLERARERYVGTVDANGNAMFVKLDDRKSYVDFFIPNRFRAFAEDGDKVVVTLVDWKADSKNPVGKIVAILGKKGEHNAEMRAIAVGSGFESDFPSNVLAEADQLKIKKGEITKEDINERLDYRDTLTLTIDPDTAKDFDDAISIKNISSDTFELGVHIADVSHYVKFGSNIDREAFERGFSVYMVDRTIPMLPEILSNDLCSLTPGEDKLAFSVILKIKLSGEVLERKFVKSVIRSDHRFSYEEAQKIIDEKKGLYFTELDTLNQISQNLAQKNREAGSIEFETDEVKFELDPQGRPIRVIRLDRLDTHKLIEELMLLANKEVATVMSKAVKEDKADLFIYRVHDEPQPEKIESYATLTRALGHNLPLSKEGTIKPKQLSEFLASLDGLPEEGLLKTAAIRSMSKALYSIQNTGHYGLSFDNYSHFTSPIRRYSDLAAHRLLIAYLKNKEIKSREAETYLGMIDHLTERENAAVEAERASIKYKHVEYMLSHIGEVFTGIITGVSEWGIYVEEEETKAEGMISTKSIDEPVTYDREGYRMIADRSKRVFRLGDKLRFKVIRADLDKKQLDYELVDQEVS